jgi:hypothetical protein
LICRTRSKRYIHERKNTIKKYGRHLDDGYPTDYESEQEETVNIRHPKRMSPLPPPIQSAGVSRKGNKISPRWRPISEAK